MSSDLLAQATFGLIGIFGGIAVAAALVFLAKARDLLNRSLDDYQSHRELSPEAARYMRSSMDASVRETRENVFVIYRLWIF